MLSIHQVINKLQALNQTPNPSEIDFDLMLDYTRHLYDLLLEQKANTLRHAALNFTVPQTQVISDFEQRIIEAKPIGNMLQDIVDNIAVQPSTTTDTNALNEEIDNIFSVQDLEVQRTNVETSEDKLVNNIVSDADEFIAEMESITKPFEKTALEKEAEIEMVTPIDFGGISLEIPTFEYVSAPISTTNHQEDVKPLTTKEPLEIANNSLEQQEEQQFTSAQGFVAPISPIYKDFRTNISFNDHYLFLNELFHNRKELMDSTISSINATTALGATKTWQLIADIAKDLKWETEDSTVQSFYALLDKHFTTI